MKTLDRPQPAHRRRGAALLLSVLVLFVLIAIVFQISIGTMTDARIGRNDVGLTLIDRSICSAQWDVYEMLKLDSEEAAEGGGEESMPMGGAGMGTEGFSEEEPPADSRKDEWAMPQRTEINETELRVLVEAENAKYNVLNLLVGEEMEEEAEEAFQRVVRIIDLYREGTEEDISDRDAEDMVREMKDFLLERNRTNFPLPELLTFDEERDGLFLPLSLRDFLVLEHWHERYFRCYRDQNDVRVHSLDQFLTVWSSPGLASDLPSSEDTGGPTLQPEPEPEPEAGLSTSEDSDEPASEDDGGTESSSGGGTAGYGVNINLAPEAVLAGLFDDRDVTRRFWSDVIEYRNLEEEDDDEEDLGLEPIYDEFNNEIVERRAFETLEELSEVRSWDDNDPETQSRIMSLLETESEVFTIYITARRDMSSNQSLSSFNDPRERARAEEEPTGALMRTVRMVVWRTEGEDGVEIIPIVPWEVLDFAPFEIKDYAEEEY
jgi:hypothetical protein